MEFVGKILMVSLVAGVINLLFRLIRQSAEEEHGLAMEELALREGVLEVIPVEEQWQDW